MNGRAKSVRAKSSVALTRIAWVRKRCPAPPVHGRPESSEGKLHSVIISGFFVHVEVLRKYMDDATTIFALLKDRVAGRYTRTPWRTVSALTAALLYVLAPLDVIADFIPFMGYVDDAAVFAFALNFARLDLDAYREWKRANRASTALNTPASSAPEIECHTHETAEATATSGNAGK